jgi:hypothetical protein
MGKTRAAKRRARRARRRLQKVRAVAGTGYCEQCDKIVWATLETANSMVDRLKSQPSAREPHLLDMYRCPSGNGWHIGHNYKLKWISLCIGEHR